MLAKVFEERQEQNSVSATPWLGFRLEQHGRTDLPRAHSSTGEMAIKFPACGLPAVVVQWTGRWRACDAGDRAEIFVDGP
jgi:hypothetical protein